MSHPSQESRNAMRAQNVTRILALMFQQHIRLKDKMRDIVRRTWPAPCAFDHRKIKTLRYWNPTAERTAAENPIVMASHGWWTADKETPTATPPAWMHECIWIWEKLVNYHLVHSLMLCSFQLGSLTRLSFPFGFRSTATAAAATALAARAR